MISIKNLSKTFNKNIHAVRNVDLEIDEGEVVVIVGPVSYTHLTLPTICSV